MGLPQDLLTARRDSAVIILTTVSDPLLRAASNDDPALLPDLVSPLSPLPDNKQQQHQQQQHQSSPSTLSSLPSSSMLTKDEVLTSAVQEVKKKKKKKSKSSSSTLTPVEIATPPPAPTPTSAKQDDTLTEESLDWLDSAVVRGDTKPTGKKSKAKKKVAVAATKKLADQAKPKASPEHSGDKNEDVVTAPVTVSISVEPPANLDNIEDEQAPSSTTVTSGNESLAFLDDDFMNTESSNWADDIDDYEHKQYTPTSTSTTTSTTPTQQADPSDTTPKTIVHKGSVVTQVAPSQSHDARFSSAPDPRKSRSWEPAPRPFKTRPWKAPERSSEYQHRPPREYSERPSDYHQRPLPRFQSGYPVRPPMNGPPPHPHQRPMSGRPSYQQHYPARPQDQQPYFERNIRPPHPRPTGQHDQPRRFVSSDSAPGPSSNPAQVPSKEMKPDGPWQSSSKQAWGIRRGSCESQLSAESQIKPEEGKKNTTLTVTSSAHQSAGEPGDKRAPGPDTTSSQKTRPKEQEQPRRFSRSQDQPQSKKQVQAEDQSKDQPLPQSESQQLPFSHPRPQAQIEQPLKVVAKTAPAPWGDRDKVVEFFSKRWMEARMDVAGRPDSSVVYASSP
ncbi:hypothetical protein BGX29_010015 [Mortierella sp. GBA35]|nr:hypothetical protein BGX23_012365 [Mortierella sp. AD031]KAF9106259.1 hypothetical protein BGX29_010015 [Mortierella sp. GBA35]